MCVALSRITSPRIMYLKGKYTKSAIEVNKSADEEYTQLWAEKLLNQYLSLSLAMCDVVYLAEINLLPEKENVVYTTNQDLFNITYNSDNSRSCNVL